MVAEIDTPNQRRRPPSCTNWTSSKSTNRRGESCAPPYTYSANPALSSTWPAGTLRSNGKNYEAPTSITDIGEDSETENFDLPAFLNFCLKPSLLSRLISTSRYCYRTGPNVRRRLLVVFDRCRLRSFHKRSLPKVIRELSVAPLFNPFDRL